MWRIKFTNVRCKKRPQSLTYTVRGPQNARCETLLHETYPFFVYLKCCLLVGLLGSQVHKFLSLNWHFCYTTYLVNISIVQHIQIRVARSKKLKMAKPFYFWQTVWQIWPLKRPNGNPDSNCMLRKIWKLFDIKRKVSEK